VSEDALEKKNEGKRGEVGTIRDSLSNIVGLGGVIVFIKQLEVPRRGERTEKSNVEKKYSAAKGSG